MVRLCGIGGEQEQRKRRADLEQNYNNGLSILLLKHCRGDNTDSIETQQMGL